MRIILKLSIFDDKVSGFKLLRKINLKILNFVAISFHRFSTQKKNVKKGFNINFKITKTRKPKKSCPTFPIPQATHRHFIVIFGLCLAYGLIFY